MILGVLGLNLKQLQLLDNLSFPWLYHPKDSLKDVSTSRNVYMKYFCQTVCVNGFGCDLRDNYIQLLNGV